jgi:ParB/RepB/Spo0J family partition protein
MSQYIKTVQIDKLKAHPDNPNRMSDKTFAKLVRNIKRTGRYEPIIVRTKGESYEIINGHHRVKALQQLGIKSADIVIWDVNDDEVDILLTTLNRLSGSDELDKKLAILRRLNEKMRTTELAKLLPFSSTQIKRLKEFKLPTAPVKIEPDSFAHPMVFFINKEQKQIIEKAIHEAQATNGEITNDKRRTKAAALTHIAQTYIENNCQTKNLQQR